MIFQCYFDLNEKFKSPILISGGCAESPDSTQLSYGGFKKRFPPLPFPLKPVTQGPFPIEVDSCTGNVLLISREVFNRLGYLSTYLTHSYGDSDYSTRAKKLLGARLYVSSIVALCSQEVEKKNAKIESFSFLSRIKKLISNKGFWFRGKYFLPYKEYIKYCKTSYGWMWMIAFLGKQIQFIYLELLGTKKNQ